MIANNRGKKIRQTWVGLGLSKNFTQSLICLKNEPYFLSKSIFRTYIFPQIISLFKQIFGLE